jgi:hypothetical protein
MTVRGKLALISALSLVGLACSTGAAWAYNYGSGHPISGTCREDGAWVTSNNIRTRSNGADSSRVQFSQTPTHGIAFYVRDVNSGIGHGIVYAPPLGTWLDLADGDAPYQFRNVFRLQVSGHQSTYEFSGSEQY